MSGSTGWDALPKSTRVRLSAIAVLKSAGTLAGPRVFDSRLDPIETTDMPAIVVTSSENRQTMSGAGNNATFRVAYALRLQGIVIAAAEHDAVLQADTLRVQMLTGLLEDPVWPGTVEAINAAEDTLWVGRTDNRYERQTVVTLNTSYREEYTPRTTSPLQPGGQPNALRTVIAPLTTIDNTVKLPSGDEFGIDVTVEG